ncbi:MAG: hypothetical protein IPH07_25760 [Deltaproteobacteria bacterium]|nr:hypothetical protein [Deltaproteobacteria bacterium]
MPPRRPSLRPLSSLLRAGSLALAGALLVASVPTTALAAPSKGQIEQLYDEGDKKNSDGDFKGAAEAWGRLLVLLSEEQANRATRESLLLNILDAYMNAYLRIPAADGKKDIAQLREGKTTFELYLKQYHAVYGKDRAISAAVQQKADELTAALAKAEEEAKGPTVVEPAGDGDPKGTDDDKTNVTPINDTPPGTLPPENNGMGLIVGGAVTAGLGLGAIGMLIAGSLIGQTAERDFERADVDASKLCAATSGGCSNLSAEDQMTYDALIQKRDDADKRGGVANAVTIAGAVLTPVLLGAGATMLALGIKRKRAADSARKTVSLAPAFGRGFTGISIAGRF